MTKVELHDHYEGTVVQIILSDGKGNVLDNVMMEELYETFITLSRRRDLRLITVEGAGRHFSFGASVEEHQQEFAATMLAHFHRLLLTMVDIQVPLLAKISGQCLGGGLELALVCHQLFTDRTAHMGQPEIQLGVFAPPASVLLPEKIGLSMAEDLLLSGRSIPAEEALQMGLVHRVYDDRAAMEAGVKDWIETWVLPRSALSLRYAVRAGRIKLRHILGHFLPQLERLYLDELMRSADANEGIQSFIEKRKPFWNNA